MNTYAVLTENVVENIIVANTQTVAEEATEKECVRYDETNPAQIGYTYDRDLSVFVPPVSPTE